MDEDEAREDRRRYFRKARTKGFIKLQNYFEEFIRRDGVQEKLNVIKKLSDAPRQEAIEKLCRKYGLLDPAWNDVVEDYLAGKYDRGTNMTAYAFDLCCLDDLNDPLDQNDEMWGLVRSKLQKDIDDEYPVAIRVSPHATIQDIISFVNKNSRAIKLFQEKYKDKNIKIGASRSKSMAGLKRADLIYENRDLSLEEIGNILTLHDHTWSDVGHIGKLLSIEKKKRKQV